MKLGVTFPQTEIGTDPAVIRDWAQTADEAGYDYLIAYDHVLGADPSRFDGPVGGFPRAPYTAEHQFHEVFALFSHLAAVTRRIEFVTSVLVLPQRQTALAAKQAAAVDILSGGRLRLSVGVGWNFAEYEALNEDFHTRGRRIEEQITVMRRLWTEPLVTFTGRYHTLDRVGITPLPVQRPIPIWIGSGSADLSLRRVARLADGWMPLLTPSEDLASAMERLRGFLREAGRDPAAFGIEGRATLDPDQPDAWLKRAAELKAVGITHFVFNAGRRGFSPAQHIDAVQRSAEALKQLGL